MPCAMPVSQSCIDNLRELYAILATMNAEQVALLLHFNLWVWELFAGKHQTQDIKSQADGSTSSRDI